MLGVETVRRTLAGRSAARWPAVGHQRRSVAVSVLVDGREVDAFAAREPAVLWAALAPVLRYLPAGRGCLRLSGVVERWSAFGLGYRRQQWAFATPLAALAFLEGAGGPSR